MARTINRLTDKAVQSKKAKGLYADGGGLFRQVSDSGAKSWIFRFKQSGRARDMGLGGINAVSLAQARQRAAEARRQRTEGKDPITERDAQRRQERLATARSVTFEDCAEQLIASHEAGWKNAKHRAQWRSTLATYVHPTMGSLPIATVDTDHVMRVLQPIWGNKTETASRVRGRIEAVLSWAKARGHRSGENPAQWRGHLDQLLPKRTKVRRVEHHPALLYKAIPGFMGKLRAKEGITARALEYTILTAARTNEAIGAKFSEIDLRDAVWRIPGDRMKAGQEHRVPLCKWAVEIVREMAKHRLSVYVFPGMRRDQALSNMAMLMLLRELAPGVTVHGFRSSFRDWAGEETTYPHDICEAALAHTRKDKAHAAYQRGDLLEKRRSMMSAWGDYCRSKVRHKGGADAIELAVSW